MAHECSCRHDSPLILSTTPPPVHAEQTVAEVTQHRAGALEILKEMGINHCCGAHLTLREAAAAAGVPLDALLTALNEPRRTPA
jgi:iron-sulfur cluster repair protein YtfE (RIC family)